MLRTCLKITLTRFWYSLTIHIVNIRGFLPFLLVFLIFPGLYASPYDMIPVGDPVLDDITFLSLESGKALLSFTPPISPHELRIFLDSIDPNLLSPPALEAYNRAENRLNPQSRIGFSTEYFSLQFGINSTIELSSRFNENIRWFPFYHRTPALLSLPVNLFFVNSIQLFIEPSAGFSPQYYRSSGNISHNIFLIEPANIDMSMPLRAYIAAGGLWWNFQFGRDRLSYGTGQTGNLAISDNPDFYDFARLQFFSSVFKYSLLVSQMPMELNSHFIGSPLDPNYFNLTTQRHYYLHRIDINLFNRLSIGLMEGLMVGNSPLEIRYLNPMMIFHSLFSWWNYPTWNAANDRGHLVSSSLSIEVNWNIINSLAFYGQFFMNEFATAHEFASDPNQPPNGMGYMGGFRYSHTFNKWASVFYIEFIKTDPYLYMTSTPFASFIYTRFYSMAPGRLAYTYLGYPRDTISFALGGTFFNGDNLSFNAGFTWVSAGEHNRDGLVWKYEESLSAFYERTPTGNAKNTFVFSLGAKWQVNTFFSLAGNIDCIYARNNNHIYGNNVWGGQAVFSINFSY